MHKTRLQSRAIQAACWMVFNYRRIHIFQTCLTTRLLGLPFLLLTWHFPRSSKISISSRFLFWGWIPAVSLWFSFGTTWGWFYTVSLTVQWGNMYQILELPHNMAQVDPFCTNCSDSKQHVGVQIFWIPIIHSVFHCESTSVPKLAAGRSMSVEEPETFILYIHRKRTISNPNVQLCNFAGTWLGKPSHRQWMTMIRWHSVTEIYIYTCIYIICWFGGLPSWNGKEAMQKKPMQVNSLAQWIFSIAKLDCQRFYFC